MSKVKIIGKAKQKESYDPSEYQIHKAFVDYVRKAHPHIAKLLIHIANEGERTPQGHKAQELLGLMPGCADIFIAKPITTIIDGILPIYEGGLWLELKTKKGKLSKAQQEFKNTMEGAGYCAAVAYSIDEAIQILEDYLK